VAVSEWAAFISAALCALVWLLPSGAIVEKREKWRTQFILDSRSKNKEVGITLAF
jgi:hypothetical protein